MAAYHVKLYRVLDPPPVDRNAPRTKKEPGGFTQEAETPDAAEAAVRLRLEKMGEVVQTVSHGPGGLVVTVRGPRPRRA